MAHLSLNPREWYLGLTLSGRYKVFSEAFALNEDYLRRHYEQVWGPFRSAGAAQRYIEELQGDVRSTRRVRRLEANPPDGVELYGQVLAIEARKGSRSLWPRENFRHDFSARHKAKVYGLEDGSILIRGPKPLWKNFSYKDKW